MKKSILILMTAGLLLTFVPLQSMRAEMHETTTLVAVKPAESDEATTLLLRLDELNAMDKTNLKSAQKKEMRKEVRSIKHQLNELGGGIYLSAGAAIIILLLLIILL